MKEKRKKNLTVRLGKLENGWLGEAGFQSGKKLELGFKVEKVCVGICLCVGRKLESYFY